MKVIQWNGFVLSWTRLSRFVRSIPGLTTLFLVMIHATSLIAQDAIRRITLDGLARTTLKEPGPGGPLNNAVCSLAFALDGKILAVGMRDPDLVLLVDPATLAVRARLAGHIALVSRVAFSPDGQTLVSAGHDGTVRVWDLSKNRQRLLIDQFQGNIRGLAISPDGQQIYTGEAIRGQKGTVQKWNFQDGRLLGSVVNYDHGIEDLKISADGLSLVICSRDQTIRLWDAKTLGQLNICEVKGRFATSLEYLPDGKSLLAVFDDRSLRSFDVSTMRETYKIDPKAKAFLQMARSLDGSIVATADMSQSQLQLWRSADGAPLATVPDVGSPITVIQFSPDGHTLVVGGLSGFLRTFQLRTEPK